MNIFKNILNLISYIKILKANKDLLYRDYNIRYDRFYRMYTQIDLPPQMYDAYKMYGDAFIEERVNGWKTQFSNFILKNNLSEIVHITHNIKASKFSRRLIIQYKYMNTVDVFKYSVLTITLIATVVTLLLHF